MMVASTEEVDHLDHEAAKCSTALDPSPAELIARDLARAEERTQAALMAMTLLEMRCDVAGSRRFHPGDSGLVAIQLSDAREHALALAEEIAELMETDPPTPAGQFIGAVVREPRGILDEEFRGLKRQLDNVNVLLIGLNICGLLAVVAYICSA